MASELIRTSRATAREGREKAIFEAARSVFAEYGFKGSTTAEIAKRAEIPKANLHYYFPTKEALYRAVTEDVLHAWLEAASSFDESADPAEAIAAYVSTKMDMARQDPIGSRIWASGCAGPTSSSRWTPMTNSPRMSGEVARNSTRSSDVASAH